jgi:hypothetical protein
MEAKGWVRRHALEGLRALRRAAGGFFRGVSKRRRRAVVWLRPRRGRDLQDGRIGCRGRVVGAGRGEIARAGPSFLTAHLRACDGDGLDASLRPLSLSF